MTATNSNQPSHTGHRLLPHTADVIIEAWAPTRDECLAEAVVALRDSYAEIVNREVTTRWQFNLAVAPDCELLVSLLEEALYVLDSQTQVPVQAHLEPRPGGGIAGWFDVADAADVLPVGSVPKGIARSALSFAEADGQWRCTVTVDV